MEREFITVIQTVEEGKAEGGVQLSRSEELKPGTESIIVSPFYIRDFRTVRVDIRRMLVACYVNKGCLWEGYLGYIFPAFKLDLGSTVSEKLHVS